MKGQSTRWLDVARKYEAEGVSEVAGPQSNPLILHWLQDDGGGKSWVKDDATPWCGAFVAGMFVEAGMGQAVVAKPLWARSWLNCGEECDLRVGAVVVLERGGNPQTGHVGFVSGWDDRNVYVLGGNQRDKVCTLPFPRADILGTRWPIIERSASEMVGESRIAAAAQRVKSDQIKGGTSLGSSPVPDALPAPKGIREGVDGIFGDVWWLKSLVGGTVDFAAFIGTHWWVIAICLAGYFFARSFWDSHRIQQFRAQDFNTGYSA